MSVYLALRGRGLPGGPPEGIDECSGMQRSAGGEGLPDALRLRISAVLFGFGTLALQIVYFRVLSSYFTMSAIVFPAVLCAYLLLMSAGQMVGGRLADRFGDSGAVIAGLFVAGALLLLMSLRLPPEWAARGGRIETVVVTPNHPYLRAANDNKPGILHLVQLDPGGDWTAAGFLRVGDRVPSAKGGELAVVANDVDPRPTRVYNLEVAADHTYAAGELQAWVHNATMYKKTEPDGSWKWGMSKYNDLLARYSKSEAAKCEIIYQGPVDQVRRMENWLVRNEPGPNNKEPYRGKGGYGSPFNKKK